MLKKFEAFLAYWDEQVHQGFARPLVRSEICAVQMFCNWVKKDTCKRIDPLDMQLNIEPTVCPQCGTTRFLWTTVGYFGCSGCGWAARRQEQVLEKAVGAVT